MYMLSLRSADIWMQYEYSMYSFKIIHSFTAKCSRGSERAETVKTDLDFS